MSLVELAPNYLTLPCESPVRKAVQKAYRWYSAAFSPHDVPRFADVGSLTESPETMRVIRDFFVARYRSMPQPPTHVMGFDARGFLLGSMIAVELNVPFVLMRKVGKNAGCLLEANHTKRSTPRQLRST
ncbi:hypothetical protein ERJ75_001783100 [Trypanosoma vivax]|nr:hypothetical protein ERJ75_001783100 [Trypanosoma vivax]